MYIHILGYHIERDTPMPLYNYEKSQINKFLYIYTKNNMVECIKKCINIGIGKQYVGSSLSVASYEGYINIVKILVDKVRDVDIFFALQGAIFNNKIEVVKLLVEYAKSHNFDIISIHDNCIIDYAMSLDKKEIVEYLKNLL